MLPLNIKRMVTFVGGPLRKLIDTPEEHHDSTGQETRQQGVGHAVSHRFIEWYGGTHSPNSM
jgi:hypothetical protein